MPPLPVLVNPRSGGGFTDTGRARVNTARSAVFKGGRIDPAQIERVRRRRRPLDARVVKVVVTHHPVATFAGCGADVVLAGHLHRSHTGDAAPLVVHAGTATSVRGRGEANAFNVLHIDAPRLRIERFHWAGGDFAPAGAETFEHTPAGWRKS